MSKSGLHAVLCAVFLAESAAGQPVFSPVILRGDSVQGLPPGATFSNPLGVGFGSTGEVVAHISFNAPGWTQAQRAIAVGRPGTMRAVVLEGQPAPGMGPGVIFPGHFDGYQTGAGGQVIFGADLRGPGFDSTNEWGYWADGPSGPTNLLQSGSEAPGLSGGLRWGRVSAAAAHTGELVVTSSLSGPGVHAGNDRAHWFGVPGQLEVLAREGDQAPGAGPGVGFALLAHEPSLADAGRVAFRATVLDDGLARQGVWFGRPGEIRVTGLAGEQVPGYAPGTVYGFVQDLPAANNAGHVAFGHSLAGAESGRVLLRDGPGGLATIAREGMQVPGEATGVVYSTLDSTGTTGDDEWQVNDRGQVAFFANMRAPGFGPFGEWGLLIGDGESTRVLARNGAQAPGLPDGDRFNSLRSIAMNNHGQLVFEGRTATNDHDLWVYDGVNVFRLLTRGQAVEVGPGDVRTVQDIYFWPGEASSQEPTLLDDGTLLLGLSFTDESVGVFTVLIPAPASSAAFGLLAVSLLRRRR